MALKKLRAIYEKFFMVFAYHCIGKQLMNYIKILDMSWFGV
jgi:hypothetical protein